VRMLSRHFGVELKVMDITRILKAFKEEAAVNGPFSKVASGNLKARTRMLALYWIANSGNYLVCGTSNKTEMLVGYFTKFGDGASDIAPLGDLFKTQVWELAKVLGVPEKIVCKVPTAGLYPGQTDEDELGVKYHVLDQILFGLDQGMQHQEIAESLEPHGPGDLRTIVRVESLIKASSHKRILTKIPKMGARTIGIDRRECVD
jgi:NAD+ synthase